MKIVVSKDSSLNSENGVGMVNVAKTEPPNRTQKRKLSASENEDINDEYTKVSYQINSW